MPRKYNRYKKYRKRYNKKQYNKRKFYGKKATTTYNNSSIGIPDRKFIKMKWAEQYRLQDVTGGLSQYYLFRHNSIYDPDYTSGSLLDSQPVGFDQWTQFYNRYRVHGSKIEIETFNYNTTSPESSVIVSVTPSSDNTTPTSITASELKLNPYAKYIVMAAASGGPQRKLTNYISTRKVAGVNDINDAAFEGILGGSGIGANPPASFYWTLAAVNVNTTPTIFNISVLVTITYYVELFDRKLLNLS